MNDVVILSKRSKTARLLAEGLDIPIVYNASEVPLDTELLIRWGNTQRMPLDVTEELNMRDAIINSSNKPKAREILREAGVFVPIDGYDSFPCIGRPTHHTSGKKFFICNTMADVRDAKAKGATYFSQIYNKTAEYRVHIGENRCILVSEKIGDKSKIIWNAHRSNFTFRHLHRSVWREDENLMNMVRMCKQAIDALGLHFGAVDVMANFDNTEMPWCISEVNTAPSLSPLATFHYMKYFVERGR